MLELFIPPSLSASDELCMADQYTGRPKWADTEYNRPPVTGSDARNPGKTSKTHKTSRPSPEFFEYSSWSDDDDDGEEEEEDNYSHHNRDARLLGKWYRDLLLDRDKDFWAEGVAADADAGEPLIAEVEWI